MRVVLDANILIGALITKGAPPDSLHQAWLRREIALVTSIAQIHELADVLARNRLRKFLNADAATAIFKNIDTCAVILAESPSVSVSPDPMDNRIPAAAVSGCVDLIVSGDRKRMPALQEVDGIPIVTAREALESLGME